MGIWRHKGFRALLLTQFLGAFNDNILRFLIVFFILEPGRLLSYPAETYIALSGALFTLPFLFFSPLAGQWTDRRAKHLVLRIAKSWEVPAMILAASGLWAADLHILLMALFCTATQAAFFGPAKYAIIPELVSQEELGRANAWIGSTTFAGILLGALLAGALADFAQPLLSGAILILIALCGVIAAFCISRTSAPAIRNAFRPNLLAEAGRLLRALKQIQTLWRAAWMISYLWFLGALLQLLLPLFGREEMGLNATATQSLLVAAAIGIALGCLAAGRLAGVGIDLKISRMGLAGMGAAALGLALGAPSYWLAALSLFALGFSGGLFIVPLYALMQRDAPQAQRGSVIAANNLLNTLALLMASLALHGAGWFGLAPAWIVFFAGLASLAIAGFARFLR